MGYRPILFDLDGTVADTYPGIVVAVGEMLAALSLAPLPSEAVYPLTGKGVPALVHAVLGLVGAAGDAATEARALELYRTRYAERCTFGARAYPGMPELLGRLARPIALLTNKPRLYTERILQALGLAQAFAVVVAGDDEGAKLKPDPWAVQQALARLNVAAPRPALVGDTRSDAAAARAAQVACMLVRWGHGGAGLDALGYPIADDVGALEALLLE